MHAYMRLPHDAKSDEPGRSEAPEPAPEVAHLLALQQSAGNAVVARAVLARKKFADQDTALEWLAGKPAQQPGQTEDAWLNALLDADTSGYELQSHRALNLRTLKSARVKAAKNTKQTQKSVRPAKAKQPKREVSDSVMTHVVDGVVKDGKPAGFHSINGSSPVMEKTGGDVIPRENGCYWSPVRSIKDRTEKKNGSTFYPDDWTPDQIKTAIEYAEGKGNSFITTDDAPIAGIPLYFNGESYYPNYR